MNLTLGPVSGRLAFTAYVLNGPAVHRWLDEPSLTDPSKSSFYDVDLSQLVEFVLRTGSDVPLSPPSLLDFYPLVAVNLRAAKLTVWRSRHPRVYTVHDFKPDTYTLDYAKKMASVPGQPARCTGVYVGLKSASAAYGVTVVMA